MTTDDRTLGQIAYETYGEDAGWVSFDGRPLPKWDGLRSELQTRWEITARTIGEVALTRSRADTKAFKRVQL